MRELRVLCLHGYHGTGAILRRQMAPLAAAIPPGVELVYADAPSLSEGDFGWWHEGFRGWERTRDWAVELLRTGPRIDGIFGFSQGAALTGLLAALRDSDPSTPQFEFAIMAGGFTSTMPQHAGLFRHKLTVPSAHVTGRADAIVPRRDSLQLADRFADPLVIEHPGGHVIPGDPAVTTPIAAFLTRFSHRAPADPPPSYQAVQNLIVTYAELVDDGDFAGLGTLLADATFTGSGAPVSGPGAIEQMFRDMLIVYGDGTPRTRHIITNIAIEVDEQAGTAASRSYFTVLQALPDLALQPIASGRYHDRFERRDGRWRFAERRVRVDLIGDVSRHLRPAPAAGSPEP